MMDKSIRDVCIEAHNQIEDFAWRGRESSCSSPSACSVLTRCEICKKDCGTMAGLIVHVRKFHPEPNTR